MDSLKATILCGLALLLPLHSFAQIEYQHIHTFELETKDFYTDQLQNVYLIRPGNEVVKFTSSHKEVFRFSNNVMGDLTFLDTNNPFQLLLYYADYNNIITLDRTLTESARFNLFDLNLLQVTTVGLANDNNLWIYDQLEFKLKKVDRNGETLVESPDLSLLLNTTLQPNYVVEKEQQVYLNDPESGILIFDVFGQYSKTLAFKQLPDFQIIGNQILFKNNQKIQGFHLQSLLTQDMPLPREISMEAKVQIQKNRLYLLEDGKLEIFEF